MTPLLLLALLGQTDPAPQGEPLPVALYMPMVFFAGPADQAAFLSKVEQAMSAAIGRPVLASFGDAAALEKAPVWVVDGVVAAARGDAKVVLSARRDDKSEWPVALYGHSGKERPWEIIANRRMVLAGGSAAERAAYRYWLLLDEPGSADATTRPRAMRDARAALAGVAGGEFDGAVLFRADYGKLDPQLSKLNEITWLTELPLPVVALNTTVLKKADVKALEATLQRTQMPTVPGVIEGWRRGPPEGYARVGQAIRAKAAPVARSYLLPDLGQLKLNLTALLPAPPALPEFDVSLLIPAPEDQPLPDPPIAPVAPTPTSSAAGVLTEGN